MLYKLLLWITCLFVLQTIQGCENKELLLLNVQCKG